MSIYQETISVVEVDEKVIYGLSVRTSNANELRPRTAKIWAMWREFNEKVSNNYRNGGKVYGVYYNYESDNTGEFDVLAGIERQDIALNRVVIHKGRYLVFHAKASKPIVYMRIVAVIETWGRILKYFSSNDARYKRAYRTDFEYYMNETDIDIYISIL